MLLFLLQILPSGVSAQSIVTNKKESRTSTINITSFPDYFPIAYTAKEGNNDVLGTIFAPAMKQIATAGNLAGVSYIFHLLLSLNAYFVVPLALYFIL